MRFFCGYTIMFIVMLILSLIFLIWGIQFEASSLAYTFLISLASGMLSSIIILLMTNTKKFFLNTYRKKLEVLMKIQKALEIAQFGREKNCWSFYFEDRNFDDMIFSIREIICLNKKNESRCMFEILVKNYNKKCYKIDLDSIMNKFETYIRTFHSITNKEDHEEMWFCLYIFSSDVLSETELYIDKINDKITLTENSII